MHFHAMNSNPTFNQTVCYIRNEWFTKKLQVLNIRDEFITGIYFLQQVPLASGKVHGTSKVILFNP